MEYLGTIDAVVFVIGLLTLSVWLFFYKQGEKYYEMFLPLDDEDFPMKELYFIGYAVCERFHVNYKTDKVRTLRRQITVLYGEKYVDYYVRSIYAQRVTMAMTIACFALPGFCFTEGSLIVFAAIYAAAGIAYYYYGTTLPDKIAKRQDEMLGEFSELVSKLALLVNAGMILHDAWEQVAKSGNSQVYLEMRRSLEEIRNGVAETDAIHAFGQRCMMPEMKKFASTLIQGLTKGASELSIMLTQQSKEVWMIKQQMMRRKGELANNKLLIPILIIFIGILIMVLVPIFAGIGG